MCSSKFMLHQCSTNEADLIQIMDMGDELYIHYSALPKLD